MPWPHWLPPTQYAAVPSSLEAVALSSAKFKSVKLAVGVPFLLFGSLSNRMLDSFTGRKYSPVGLFREVAVKLDWVRFFANDDYCEDEWWWWWAHGWKPVTEVGSGMAERSFISPLSRPVIMQNVSKKSHRLGHSKSGKMALHTWYIFPECWSGNVQGRQMNLNNFGIFWRFRISQFHLFSFPS